MIGARSRGIHHLSALSRSSRRFSATRKYNPNVVNLCLDPPRGKRFPTTALFVTIGCFLLTTPLMLMYFDNKRFAMEMERRNQPGIHY